MKRSGKFYRKNEAEVMRSLGLEPTKNSGSGWIEKEDGQSENVICQLKSTDAESIRLQKKDFDVLNYNALVAHKLPVFAIQFIKSQDVYLLMKPDLLIDLAKFIETGENAASLENFVGIDLSEHEENSKTSKGKRIRSSSSARELFNKENKEKFRKKKRSAK